MAIPVIQSVGTAATGTGTSITTNAPSGVVTGDLLVLSVATVTGTTVTTPTGWTIVDTINDGFNTSRQAMYYRIADSTADDTPTVTLGVSIAYAAFILRIDGQAASPLDVKATGSATGTTAPAVPSITTGFANELAIAAMTVGTGALTANPTNWTQKADNTTGSADLRIWSQDAPTATSYGGETATTDIASNCSMITASFKGAAFSTFNRSFSENLATSDSPSRACTNLRTASDTMGLKEVQLYKPNYKTFSPEQLAFQDAFNSRTLLFLRNFTETLGFTDAVTRSTTYLRQLSDLLALTDLLGGIQINSTYDRQLAENMGLTDSVLRSATILRALSESLGMLDLVTRRADYSRQLSENVAMQEQFSRAVTALRSISESLGFSDLLNDISTGAVVYTSGGFYIPRSVDVSDEYRKSVEILDSLYKSADEQVQ